jgi:hypothetical protein
MKHPDLSHGSLINHGDFGKNSWKRTYQVYSYRLQATGLTQSPYEQESTLLTDEQDFTELEEIFEAEYAPCRVCLNSNT